YTDMLREVIAAQHITVRCAHCRRFRYDGPLLGAQQQFAAHRADKHPELQPLALVKAEQKKARRIANSQRRPSASNMFQNRRDQSTVRELAEREQLRRLVRSDLPPTEAA